MKIQDIGFLIALAMLLFFRRPHYFVWAGLGSLLLSIPLFAKWIFFTAERLTWYAAAFFLIYIFTERRFPESESFPARPAGGDSGNRSRKKP